MHLAAQGALTSFPCPPDRGGGEPPAILSPPAPAPPAILPRGVQSPIAHGCGIARPAEERSTKHKSTVIINAWLVNALTLRHQVMTLSRSPPSPVTGGSALPAPRLPGSTEDERLSFLGQGLTKSSPACREDTQLTLLQTLRSSLARVTRAVWDRYCVHADQSPL